MEIKELYVENFGKLSKFKRTLTSGLNAFTEDNGFGKTTLTVFIKAMLYGFDESRKLSLDENDRKKYTPWQGGAFGGYMTLVAKGITYRIERTFGAKASEDTLTVYRLDTGAVTDELGEIPGETLLGIDQDGFERTVFLSEKNLSGKNTNQSISAKLSNLVGVEGDIGGFDAAIKLLDERRRFYQKKGGSGEIRELQSEISRTEDEIAELKARRAGATEMERAISASADRIKDIKARKDKALEDERAEALRKEKLGYEAQYAAMISAMRPDEEREAQLITFFAHGVPTNAEIAAISSKLEDSDRLGRAISDIEETSEIKSLRNFFQSETTVEECEKMASVAKEVSRANAELISRGGASAETESKFISIPSADKINELSIAAAAPVSKAPGGGLLLTLIGLALTAIGIFAGMTVDKILYTASILGVLLTFIGIFGAIHKKRNDASKSISDIRAYVFEIYGKECMPGEELPMLLSMRAELERYDSASRDAANEAQRLEALRLATERNEREVREFIAGYPTAEGITAEEKTEDILKKRRRYDMLLESISESDTQRAAYTERYRQLKAETEAFLSRFPTESDDPINEIRTKLAEFDVLRASLGRRRGEATGFAAEHGISGYTAPREESGFVSVAPPSELASIDEELITEERRKSKLESDYGMLIRDVERIDELEERVRELTERLDVYNENLSVITRAKELLGVAKTKMTAKYLDGTRAGFEKYISLIDESQGEFTMDTQFTVTKRDLGKSRAEEAYSRGTRDLHALAIRLSLIDALYENELPPIILDDPFIGFDDNHTEKAIAVLKKLGAKRQILYFTCSRARRIK